MMMTRVTTGRITFTWVITSAMRLTACGMVVKRGGGDRLPWTMIKDVQVREIRSALARGERVGALTKGYGVRKSTISRIKHGVRRQSS